MSLNLAELRSLFSHILISVCLTLVGAMSGETVNAFVLLLQPTPKLVKKLEFQSTGELRECVVSKRYSLIFLTYYSQLAMQCEKGTSYNPCMTTCPMQTCDNLSKQKYQTLLCNEEPCVEGCSPEPCSKGSVYINNTDFEVKDIIDIQDIILSYFSVLTHMIAKASVRSLKEYSIMMMRMSLERIPVNHGINTLKREN